jgi:hypothetical protein
MLRTDVRKEYDMSPVEVYRDYEGWLYVCDLMIYGEGDDR